jgi:hypothetical protein
VRPRRPQPATVVAVVALIIALSGTSIASVEGGSGGPDRACPPATIAAAGLCFDRSPCGPVRGVKVAADACTAAGGYLPDPGELAGARGVLGIGGGRRGLFTDSYRIAEQGGAALTAVLEGSERRWVVDEDLATGRPLSFYRYACVYPGG